MSRSKGKRGEREVAAILEDAGIHTERILDGRSQVSGDIVAYLALPLAIEVRFRETLSLSQWSRDHEASTPDHFTPAIVYRRSREPWRISMPLDQFLALLKGAAAEVAEPRADEVRGILKPAPTEPACTGNCEPGLHDPDCPIHGHAPESKDKRLAPMIEQGREDAALRTSEDAG